MPSGNWKILTVRLDTYNFLKEAKDKEGKPSIDKLIMDKFTSELKITKASDMFTSEEREILQKLHARLVSGRNVSQAKVIEKVLGV